MSQMEPSASPANHAAGPGHDEHAHPAHLAHHFKSLHQQYDSAKMGMWIFLATEILMFGGLFCAYAVYRANHPGIFMYGHHFLDTQWGAINTVVLIASSFTMAWAVRAAQTGQKTLLTVLLALTLLGGFGFMGIKAIEYSSKFSHDLWPGYSNLYYPADDNPLFADTDNPRAAQLDAIAHLEEVEGLAVGHGAMAGEAHGEADAHATDDAHAAATPEARAEQAQTAGAAEAHGETAAEVVTQPVPAAAEHSLIAPAAVGPTGSADWVVEQGDAHAGAAGHAVVTYAHLPELEQQRVHTFFQTYFLMTGLHGLHVLIGMGLIGYILVRSVRGHFSASYFTPVDLIGLYWHLVDLIWIFLFPLLYLIH